MGEFSFVDIYAAQDIEYLAVIAYLGLLIFFWRYLVRLGEDSSSSDSSAGGGQGASGSS